MASAALIEPPGARADPRAEDIATLATPSLASALTGDQFERFFDRIPLAVIVATMTEPECIVYANPVFEQVLRDKDAQLREIQHRINALQTLYSLLSSFGKTDEIDLGIYLSEIVSSVMHAHAVEGISLDLKVDSYPASVNVALLIGLVANELLTNAVKHAFVGRDGGTITLRSQSDDGGCRVIIADDGNGLPNGVDWPKRGKLGELIVRSLRQNANAELHVESRPGEGTRTTITFTRIASAPEINAGREDVIAPP